MNTQLVKLLGPEKLANMYVDNLIPLVNEVLDFDKLNFSSKEEMEELALRKNKEMREQLVKQYIELLSNIPPNKLANCLAATLVEETLKNYHQILLSVSFAIKASGDSDIFKMYMRGEINSDKYRQDIINQVKKEWDVK